MEPSPGFWTRTKRIYGVVVFEARRGRIEDLFGFGAVFVEDLKI